MRIRGMMGRWLLLSLAIVAAMSLGAAAWYVAARPDPEVLVRRAEAALQAGRFAEARACLRRLERVREPTPQDRLLRAGVLNADGDDPAALQELASIADDPELGARALMMTGLIERRRKRVRYAEEAYRKAIARDPGLVKARHELIYILGTQYRRQEVDAAFKALARLTPLAQYDLYVWALTHFVVFGPEDADTLRSFIAADPEDRHSRLALASLLLAQPGQEARLAEILGPLPQDDPDVLSLRVEQALNAGRADEAATLLAGASPDEHRLARLRGRLALRRGDRAAAVRYFRQALSEEPYDRVSHSDLGKALLLMGDRTGAETHLARARQLDEVYNLITRLGKPKADQPVEDLHRIARACEAAGLVDEARGWYSIALDRGPARPPSPPLRRPYRDADAGRGFGPSVGGRSELGR